MDNKTNKRITLVDVARDAGVSRATASLVVRGDPAISKKTAKKVLDSIQKLGYVYDRVAANLRSQQSSTIGVIIPDIGNPFFVGLLMGVHDQLDELGYTVTLGISFNSNVKQERHIESMLENRVRGIILTPAANTSSRIIERIEKLSLPIVILSREIKGLDFVGNESAIGFQSAVQHLIDNGHKRIAFLGGLKNTSAYQDRLNGYRAALETNKIPFDPSLLFPGPPTRNEGSIAILETLKLKMIPTAVICYNDVTAIGAIIGLRSVGLKPGMDMAIVGHDNIPDAEFIYPSLTTVAVDVRQWGSEAAKIIHKRILGLLRGSAQRVIMPTKLIIRDSSTLHQQPRL
jgi:LacI family transcriptional regulator